MKRPSSDSSTADAFRRIAGWTAGLVVLLAAGPRAEALPHFPSDIADHLQATVEPACSVCHLAGKTTGATAVAPLALDLKARGFDGSTGSLLPALDRLDSEQIDTDGDGAIDVDELRRGTDPNSAVPDAPSADPSYGCVVSGRTIDGSATSGAALLLLVLVSRPRRPRVRRGRLVHQTIPHLSPNHFKCCVWIEDAMPLVVVRVSRTQRQRHLRALK